MVTDRPDINLMNALRTGDVVAFNTIYTEHSKSLYIYLLHKLKDPELCNDILQDIFVNLWEKKGQLNIDVSLKSYLFQAARFKIIDVYRLDVKYQKYLTDVADYLTVEAASIIDRIEAAINNLPEKMREIFILSRYDHQSTRDIADKTKLSRQTVKNQLSKALRILRVNYISVDVITLFILSSLFAVVRF
jgi:RNA polymerase sigma factor (sigma-70 family)